MTCLCTCFSFGMYVGPMKPSYSCQHLPGRWHSPHLTPELWPQAGLLAASWGLVGLKDTVRSTRWERSLDKGVSGKWIEGRSAPLPSETGVQAGLGVTRSSLLVRSICEE